MIDIDIDVSPIAEEFALSDSQSRNLTQQIVNNVTVALMREWDGLAKNNLKKTRSQYRAGLKLDSSQDLSNKIYLVGALPLMIENGASGFDIKLGLLRSPKVKHTKKGEPYITVPFRHATSEALGENRAFSGVLPTVIHKMAKQLAGAPLQLGSIPSKFHIPKSAALRNRMKEIGLRVDVREKIVEKLPTSDRTSIYEGLKKTEGGYVTFRRVSLSSQADSWIHPGFEARNFADQALNAVDEDSISESTIDAYLQSIGF